VSESLSVPKKASSASTTAVLWQACAEGYSGKFGVRNGRRSVPPRSSCFTRRSRTRTTNAFGKCVSNTVKNEQANAAAAISSCKTAQTADPAAFKAKYGTFGKCVSATTSAANKADQAATIAAAKSCKTERAADVAAFTTKYGTGASKLNAFGRCVSSKAKSTQ
jgi:hypothetical protein